MGWRVCAAAKCINSSLHFCQTWVLVHLCVVVLLFAAGYNVVHALKHSAIINNSCLQLWLYSCTLIYRMQLQLMPHDQVGWLSLPLYVSTHVPCSVTAAMTVLCDVFHRELFILAHGQCPPVHIHIRRLQVPECFCSCCSGCCQQPGGLKEVGEEKL